MKKLIFAAAALSLLPFVGRADDTEGDDFDRAIFRNTLDQFSKGRQIFRYDTFGDKYSGAMPSSSISHWRAQPMVAPVPVSARRPPCLWG